MEFDVRPIRMDITIRVASEDADMVDYAYAMAKFLIADMMNPALTNLSISFRDQTARQLGTKEWEVHLQVEFREKGT